MKVLDAISSARILTVGDVILDKYIHGSVSRISPEAPVPVLKADIEYERLGGAANVANNVAMLNSSCIIVGTAGNDIHRLTLENIMSGLNIEYCMVDCGYKTTAKIRVVGERQQIVRIDYEDIIQPDNPALELLISKACGYLSDVDAVVISDYGKGAVSVKTAETIIQKAQSLGKVVIVDPKGADWSKYRNATVVTPNVKELGEVCGVKVHNEDDEIVKHGRVIREKYGLKYLVVTRSEKGITIISADGEEHMPTQAQEVFDVSGAGDTVVAVMACALGGGAGIKEAVSAANMGAGIVVSKSGTVPVTYAELMQAGHIQASAAITAGKLEEFIAPLREQGKTVVFTNGCFDILHRGHVDYLKKAAKLGDILIVGLNSDASVKRLKGAERPVNSQEDRAFVLANLNCVDYVVIFDEDTPADLIKKIKPDILVKGGDYKVDEVVGREDAGKVVIIDFVNGYSTTSTISRLKGDNK